MSLTKKSKTYKPFNYPEFVKIAEDSEQSHWVEQEIELTGDIRQWKDGTVTSQEKSLVIEIMKTFTQSDFEVSCGYLDNFIPTFKNNEVRMMLVSFAAREAIHQRAYALFTDTIGLPEESYGLFLEHKDLKKRMELMTDMDMSTDTGIAKALARTIISEGIALFGAFAMLLNFQRHGKMLGLCKINEWSILDEECFSDDTEVLAASGFKLFKDLKKDELVAQWDPNTKSVSYVPPSNYVDKEVDTELVLLKNNSTINQFVTKGHDIAYINYGFNSPKWLKEPAETFKPHYRRRLACSGHSVAVSETMTANEKILVALQADGSIPKGEHRNGRLCGYRKVSFGLTKQRKIDRLRMLLAEVGYSYTEKPNKGKITFHVDIPLEDSPTKYFSDWVKPSTRSSEWLYDFVLETAEWDGHWSSESNILYRSAVAENTKILQECAVLSGNRAYYSIAPDYRQERYKDMHTLSVHLGQEECPTGIATKELVAYKGRVYCVTVPTGHIIVRREGIVNISGNCHVNGITLLFNKFVEENPKVVTDKLKAEIYKMFREAIELEDIFIDCAFDGAPDGLQDLTKEELKQYVRYLADRRLISIGLRGNYNVRDNPLPWLDELISGDSLTNFFEQRVTDYAAAGLTGDWGWDEEIFIYTKPDCPYCIRAKQFLELSNRRYTEKPYTLAVKAKLQEEFGAIITTVPQIVIDNKLIGGYDDLRRAG